MSLRIPPPQNRSTVVNVSALLDLPELQNVSAPQSAPPPQLESPSNKLNRIKDASVAQLVTGTVGALASAGLLVTYAAVGGPMTGWPIIGSMGGGSFAVATYFVVKGAYELVQQLKA